jgi:methionyl-tRNA formyltransferase
MRIVFMGTPEFAVPTLEKIVESGHEIVAVFAQPDRPKGRGQQLSISPVKEAALQHGLRIEQPQRIRRPEVIDQLAAMRVDCMVVVGYGQIIPQTIIDLPPLGIINVHASLLPKYRGAAPVQWAIARGETRTGVTTMKIDAGLDTGDMLMKWETDIAPEENAVELGGRLAAAGALLLVETLRALQSGAIIPVPQDNSEATLAPIIKKEDGQIDWSWSARDVVNRSRGFVPWPGTYTRFRGRHFNIWRARTSAEQLEPGSLARAGKRVLAGTGEGSVELLEVQMEGKKRVDAGAFWNGYQVKEGERLG